MTRCLLDTDILSELLKQQNKIVVKHASDYLQQFGAFTFSNFTCFEVIRGLREKRAITQLSKFDVFCRHSDIVPINDEVIDIACDLWVLARQGGHPYGDADLIIAASAVVEQLTLVTGNTGHFNWIPSLQTTDWRNP